MKAGMKAWRKSAKKKKGRTDACAVLLCVSLSNAPVWSAAVTSCHR